MAYELDLERGVFKSTVRTYRKVLKKALGVLSDPQGTDDPVHDAHTGVKKARTLLRLERCELGGSRYQRENDALRDAGHALTAVRDATILVDVLGGLLERGDEQDRSHLASLRATLEEDRARGEAGVGEVLAEAARVLTKARDRAAGFPSGHRGWKALAPGLDRAYRRGLDRFARAYATGRDEDFHALRKVVKDLGYQARYVRPIHEPSMCIEEGQLKQLGGLLGDDHDLAVLRAVGGRSLEATDPGAVERLEALVGARQIELRREAHAVAEALFAEPPEQRLGRMEAMFREARARADAAARTPRAA